MKILALLLTLSTHAFADARKDTLACTIELDGGAKTSFTMALEDYDDEEMGMAEEDGEQGTAIIEGYTIRYVTAAGAVHCPECRTGATKEFYSTLTLSRDRASQEAFGGGVFSDVSFRDKITVPGVKALGCTYVSGDAR